MPEEIKKKSAVELIADERKKQIEKFGFDLGHDSYYYEEGQLLCLALYALTGSDRYKQIKFEEYEKKLYMKRAQLLFDELSIIGAALIAAEYDRKHKVVYKEGKMNELTFKRLSIVNKERCLKHYQPIKIWSPTDYGCAVSGETGELCNILKKLKRIDDGLEKFNKQGESKQNLLRSAADEIGDVVIYLDLLAHRLNLDFEECVRSKFNYNSKLIGSKHLL